jgi:hypothetical protein
MKKIILLGFVILSFLVGIAFVNAVGEGVCCEKTKSGLYCQNVPEEECEDSARTAPTACESTSYCKPGVCFNSNEGTCLDNTPQLVCNQNDGIWSQEQPAACNLGCCVLGDQAAFVSLTRCKFLSSTYGLKTNYDQSINDEVSCVLSVRNQDKGACVFDYEFQRTCKFTTRAQCSIGFNGTGVEGEFFKDKLCSAPELETNCGPSKETACAPGKDEVYFVDTCGNIANIYDASKISDQEYWSNYKTKDESCSPNSGNANSKTCGNCNYIQGSYCRPSENAEANYGDYICSDLNCRTTSNGKSYKHGESWCVYNDEGEIGTGSNTVGSQFFKHICINGEEVLEACADYRQQECIEGVIEYAGGEFSQAACRVNRWQDCTAQTEQEDCENTDRRDCIWRESYEDMPSCIPLNSPGLQFWNGEETKEVCAQANYQCKVVFEKRLFGSGDGKCISGCDCITEDWKKQRIEFCEALGDCGAKTNWIGVKGYKEGYELKGL